MVFKVLMELRGQLELKVHKVFRAFKGLKVFKV